MERFKRILTALAAVSAILLALTRIGVAPIAPGLPTGFEPSSSCSTGTLCFITDCGDLKTLVTLWVTTREAPRGWHAELSDGTRLIVAAGEWRRNGYRVVLMKPDSLSRLAKFAWPSGTVLRLTTGSAADLHLADWRLDLPDKEGYDSRSRARWRGILSLIYLLLLCIGVISAFFVEWFKHPQAPDVRTLCTELVRLTISKVDGPAEEEPEVMRALLGDVLLSTVPPRQAMSIHAGGRPIWRQQQIWFAARSRFFEHWEKLLHILDGYRDQLDPGPP